MIKTNFQTKQEAEDYLKTEKALIENKQSALSYSEREKIKNNIIKPESLVIAEEKIKLPIITDIAELRKPCLEVTKEDNINDIIKKLKDTLENRSGLGISANQIGIQKKISYIKMPKLVDKKIEFEEYILINAKIIEQDKPIKVRDEGCLSFPEIYVDTKRYIFTTVEYLNEKMEKKLGMYQDIESFCVAHEIDHQNGKTIFDRKWVNK
jgi:peptide deformylase